MVWVIVVVVVVSAIKHNVGDLCPLLQLLPTLITTTISPLLTFDDDDG
jgi:hypothetical protein